MYLKSIIPFRIIVERHVDIDGGSDDDFGDVLNYIGRKDSNTGIKKRNVNDMQGLESSDDDIDLNFEDLDSDGDELNIENNNNDDGSGDDYNTEDEDEVSLYRFIYLSYDNQMKLNDFSNSYFSNMMMSSGQTSLNFARK